jgi:hypothetical protein
MSVKAYTWAIKQAGLSPGAKLLLLVLAEHADPAGVGFTSREIHATECCYTKQSVTANMGKLKQAGLVRTFERRRRNGSRTSDWWVLAPGAGDRGDMYDASRDEYPAVISDAACQVKNLDLGQVKLVAGSGQVSTPGQVKNLGRPDPSEEPVSEPEAVANATEVSPPAITLKIGARKVNAAAWTFTEKVLAEFNQQTGRDMRLVTSGGVMSQAAGYIYKRIREYPDLSLQDFQRIIANTIASRWWSDGRDDGEKPSFNVIFGPKIFEANIGRKPPKREVWEEKTLADRERERWAAVMELGV